MKLNKKVLSLSAIVPPVLGLVLLAWWVSDPGRAGKIDRFFLYHVDDIFRYAYIKSALFYPSVFFNPYVKPGYALLGSLWHRFLPQGIFALRLMNVFFSCATLYWVYRICRKLDLSAKTARFAVLLTVTFPLYWLLSISTLSEIIFSFFLVLIIAFLVQRKYSLVLFFTALLPLFKQVEGIFLLFVLTAMLFREVSWRKLLFLPIPFVIWMGYLMVFSGYQLGDLIFYLPNIFPENSLISGRQFLFLIGILLLHPLVLLSGFSFKSQRGIKQDSYGQICLILLAFLGFFAVFQLVHWIHSVRFHSTAVFCRELRLLMPIVPLMAIVSSQGIQNLWKRSKVSFSKFFAAMTVILICISWFQVKLLQKDPLVQADSLTLSQEQSLASFSKKINQYLQGSEVKTVGVPGSLTTDKIFRRLWLYLPGEIGFYALKEEGFPKYLDQAAFDMLSMTFVEAWPLEGKAVLITDRMILLNSLPAGFNGFSVVEDPVLGLYVYSLKKAEK
jgi:hypothetical protein